MNIKWLPIGSVVLLAEEGKPLMICGRVQKEREKETLWDYSACTYPEGNIAPEKTILFNHDQIHSLLFIGYQTEENSLLTSQLDDLVEQERQGQKRE